MAHRLVDTINDRYRDTHPERGEIGRRHLGGSMIGKKCERELYYSFRWFKRPAFEGRMLRLFDRGHAEEFKNVNLLRSIGIEVRAYSKRLMYHPESDSYLTAPWDQDSEELIALAGTCDDVTTDPGHVERAEAQGVKLEQWRISDVMGHFGGSLDGEGLADFDIPITEFHAGRGLVETGRFIVAGEKFLTEFKTHNTKSFVDLTTQGVRLSKPVHWMQMQIYMHKRGLKYALYMAVNKNDDDLWIEIIEYDPEVGPRLLEKAKKIIHSQHVPDRIGNHPSWYECKFCEFAKICHYGDQSQVARHCRTCVNSIPVDGGQWHCKLWNATIPVDVVPVGCDSYKVITD